jgi:hypothetical protein
MIPYVEVRDKYTLKALAPVEPQECCFELGYQDACEFEVYCRASAANLRLLQKGRYVTIPNKPYIWVITAVRYTTKDDGARMISATGFEAKWLLSKRCILTPKELSGTITNACYGLVNHALGTGANAARTISDNKGNNKFFVASNNITSVSVEGTQAPRGNLLEFVTTLLKERDCGHIVTLENETLLYTIFKGADRSASMRFSNSLDNLLSSEYLTDDAEKSTYALVVSTVDDVDYTQEYNNGGTGIDRAEIVIASNLSTKYEDANGEEQETTPDSTLYKGWQIAEAKANLAERTTVDEIGAEIDITNTRYIFGEHFFLGDTVGAIDEYFRFSVTPQISKYTFKQDANGYGEEAEYGGKQ